MKPLKFLLFLTFIFSPGFMHAQSPDLELGEYVVNCDEISAFMFINDPESDMYIISHWGDGSSDITSTFDTSSSTYFFVGISHAYTSLGTYTNKHVLYNSADIAVDSFSYSVDIGCSAVAGRSYIRRDADCEFNGTDEYLGAAYNMRIDKDGTPIDTIWTYGAFVYPVDTSDYSAVYTLQPISTPPGYTLVCPDSGHYDFTLADLYTTPYFDFGFDCDATTFDLYTYIGGGYRSVDTSYVSISYGNLSCTPHDGTITLNIDSQYDFAGASLTPTSVSGSTVTWNITGISGAYEWYSSHYIMVRLVPNGTLELGNIACNNVTITPTMGDADITNNAAEHCDSIRSSLDPNSKSVSPSGAVDAGTKLIYTINFENLGNDSAFNIHILDTLSGNLDATTFEVINSSHLMTTSLSDYGGTKIVRFDFADIMLPDRSSPNHNKGFVTYAVNARTSLAPSDQINNTAYIYFDINPAIITNTVTNFIPDPTGLKQLSAEDGISIFPNPTENEINIINGKGSYQQLILVNSLGQSILKSSLRKGDNSVSLAQLPSGMYYAVFIGKGYTRSTKIIKK